MYTNECVAMVLAGGRGERLGALTRYYAKPSVHFGRDKRIIDFTMNNCKRSGISTIGILTQYFGADLHAYISTTYNDSRGHGQIHMLPPKSNYAPYIATADAVYKNIGFIDQHQPEHVLILAGDHIYNMDYDELIAFHKNTGADVTVASTEAPIKEAYRFGILSAYADGFVYGLEENPRWSKNNLASMGIYVFKWAALRRHLLADSENTSSHHDFGEDIIPGMLSSYELMYTYKFKGYWRAVGTVDSLWEANMDLLTGRNESLFPDEPDPMRFTPYHISGGGVADQSIISENCTISGKVKSSVLADSVTVSKGAEIVDSVVMPGAYIGENVKIYKAIVGTEAKIMNNAEIGAAEGTGDYIDRQICREDISLVAPWAFIPEGMRFQKNSQIYGERMQGWEEALRTAARTDDDPEYPMSTIYVPRNIADKRQHA